MLEKRPKKDEIQDETEKEAAKIGYLCESQNYNATFAISKASSEQNVWPINQPLPIYLDDEHGNVYLVHVAEMIAPSTDLPSLTVVEKDKVVIVNPARSFILESGLTTLVAKAIQVNPKAIVSLMDGAWLASGATIKAAWEQYGFGHLKLVAAQRPKEEFAVFMAEFASRYSVEIKEDETKRKEILRTLTEIGKELGYIEDNAFLNAIRAFMADDSVALLVDQSTAKIRTLLKDKRIKYGDLVCFQVGNDKYLMIVEKIDALATVEPLIALEADKTTASFYPLEPSTEGGVEGVSDVIHNLFTEANDGCHQVPVGSIPGATDPYTILIKGNALIHFAIIAISGKGKGNFNKKFILELMRQQVERKKADPDAEIAPDAIGVILFDDAGEYIKCKKEKDWGLNVATLAFHLTTNQTPSIHFVDITTMPDSRDDSSSSIAVDNPTILKLMKIPVENIPMAEVLRSLENKVAYDVIPDALRYYYQDEEHRPERADFDRRRMAIGFINWFLFDDEAETRLKKAEYQELSINAGRRALRNFIFANMQYLGIRYISDAESEKFVYLNSIGEEEANGGWSVKPEYNLLGLALKCADNGEILVLDESGLERRTKLLVQRVILDHILSQREGRGADQHLNPCLFIVEEATALMRDSGSGQLDLYAEVAVKARKYCIGIGLVFQNVDKVDPILLQQLGWTVIMGLPVDAMRANLAKNVPSDMAPYDTYIKRADTGVAIGIQQKVGSGVTLPFKINYYEQDVTKIFASLDKDLFELAIDRMKACGVEPNVIKQIEKMVKKEKESGAP